MTDSRDITTHEIFLSHSLRNGWTAVAVRYEDDSNFAKVRLQSQAYKGTVVEAVMPTDHMGGSINHCPAFENAPEGAIDYLVARVSSKIICDKMARKRIARSLLPLVANGGR